MMARLWLANGAARDRDRRTTCGYIATVMSTPTVRLLETDIYRIGPAMNVDSRWLGSSGSALASQSRGPIELGGALQQARVQVEDVAGIGLAAGRAAQQKRHLPVGDRLLGKVVVGDHACMPLSRKYSPSCSR